MPWKTTLTLTSILFALASCRPPAETADLVLRRGKVVTMDPGQPEAQALAVRGDEILAVGSDEQIAAYVRSSTRVIDLGGGLAVPGFIEGHAHFLGIGKAARSLKLQAVRSWDEVVALVAEAAQEAAPGERIRGRGWHQAKWDHPPDPELDGYPYHHALSAVSPDNPVVLSHASGHAVMANAKAMEVAGITAETHDPPGGEIVRDAAGRPTGLFRDNAEDLLEVGDEWNEAATRKEALLAAEECLANGITTFHDAGSSLREVDVFKKLAAEGALGLRLWVMLREPNDRLAEALPAYRLIDYGGGYLTVRAIKLLMDGALGTHTAWLLEPYADRPESTGLDTVPLDTASETARLALEHGFQLCTHAIGDRANRETLDLYEEAFRAHPQRRDLRWRIEHAQHLSAEDIPRFGELGVIAAMQGIHCASDGPWVPLRVGERRAEESAYVWQKLMQSGAVVVNGTDAPVEDVSPVASFYASVSRRLADGSVFYPDQRMSRQQALASYTTNAAYAGFEENRKGTLSPGKLADITVLSKDILTVSEEEILDTEVLYTIVGGEVRHERRSGSGG